MSGETRLVWDIPLRAFHWLLAVSVGASWATAEAGVDWMEVHFWLGYWTMGLLTFRIIWGFVGPRHARFASFLPSPAAVWRYGRTVLTAHAARTAGHNPIGALMVIAFLALLGVQVATGLFASDDILFSGPYHAAVDGDVAEALTSLHHANFNWILVAVIVHVVAALFYLIAKKQNLIAAMITGRKPAADVPEHSAIAHSQLLRAAMAVVIAAAVVAAVIGAAPEPSDDFYY